MTDTNVIEIRDVSTVLGGVVIHRHLDLRVNGDEVLGIIGGSGSGKTTLLRLMVGLEVPSEGEVWILGRPLGRYDTGHIERARLRSGVLFQQGALFSALDVFDNIALPLRELKAVPPTLVAQLVMRKLAQVGLQEGDATKMPAELSGGMIKRVALARALILEPRVLFLDEPTAGLDPASAKQFVTLIRDLRREFKLTVAMVTHDVDTLFALADRVAVLAEQRLIAIGTLQEVAGHAHPFIRNFFLGHGDRCAEESVRGYRDSLAREHGVVGAIAVASPLAP
jgi:phospholipid/cholesterol/gamma-HCH transport system ATP-binding protein